MPLPCEREASCRHHRWDWTSQAAPRQGALNRSESSPPSWAYTRAASPYWSRPRSAPSRPRAQWGEDQSGRRRWQPHCWHCSSPRPIEPSPWLWPSAVWATHAPSRPRSDPGQVGRTRTDARRTRGSRRSRSACRLWPKSAPNTDMVDDTVASPRWPGLWPRTPPRAGRAAPAGCRRRCSCSVLTSRWRADRSWRSLWSWRWNRSRRGRCRPGSRLWWACPSRSAGSRRWISRRAGHCGRSWPGICSPACTETARRQCWDLRSYCIWSDGDRWARQLVFLDYWEPEIKQILFILL